MYQKKLNKNITVTQKEDALESIMQHDRDSFLSYRFEIMDDDNIYSISFRGKLADGETKKIWKQYKTVFMKEYQMLSTCIWNSIVLHTKILSLAESLWNTIALWNMPEWFCILKPATILTSTSAILIFTML